MALQIDLGAAAFDRVVEGVHAHAILEQAFQVDVGHDDLFTVGEALGFG